MTKEDNRTFEAVVRSITNSEEDVDKVLTAARLTRIEAAKTRLTGEQKKDLLSSLMVALTIVAVLTFLVVMFKL